MPTPFLSSEEYDERAHRLYDQGDFDAALETLREGLSLYPHSVELYVGLGYVRMAREEYLWARHAFQRALVLDPEHEDGLVGLGEALLRFGEFEESLALFARARETCEEDLDLMMSMGRALYREHFFEEAKELFERTIAVHPDSAEAAAAFAFTLHRLDDEIAARRQLRRALHIDDEYHEARVYLAHLLYDRGDWAGALREFERVPAGDHFDTLAVWRVLELRRALCAAHSGDPELLEWERRLQELEAATDPVDELLAEVEAAVEAADEARSLAAGEVEAGAEVHRVQLAGGTVLTGSWAAIVEQIRETRVVAEARIAQFMRRGGPEAAAPVDMTLPTEDPHAFLVAGERAGYWHIEY
ncbi:MAG TPA: tetratricopeptide repeat protein [Longimicrobiales bacterium]|nr:tetratricopeptide repeat protein [Longimicrobiales bacterium]